MIVQNGQRHQPELLAPAGNWECARAAVENGADAIYFGLPRFNARIRADNFTEADLPELMSFLHSRGVRGYVTFNTLVFTDELEDAENYLQAIIASGVDAAIVQDVGICRLIRKISPDFPIHASTQMSVTSAAGVRFARELGASVVVLARENSIADMECIQKELANEQTQIPLEVFVHGALCVAYSGQCLTSEALGGRSANRGECAQACRMTYDLYSDGDKVDLGDRRYLLSPQDLSGITAVTDLIRAGIASFKIEGRLKQPEYVASITRVYRKAIDDAIHALSTAGNPPLPEQQKQSSYELEMSFSRGLHSGWLHGIDNQKLVHARYGKKRGVFLGEVLAVEHNGVWLSCNAPVQAGDGIVFDDGRPDSKEEGCRIHEVITENDEIFLRLPRESIDFQKIHPGQKIWKTSDPTLDKELRQTWQTPHPRHRRPVYISCYGKTDQHLVVEIGDEKGNTVQVTSSVPLKLADQQPLCQALLEKQLGRLGNTPFRLEKLNSTGLAPDCILPLSELNQMRRKLATELEKLRARPQPWTVHAETKMSKTPSTRYRFLKQAATLCDAASESGVTTMAGAAPTKPEVIPLIRNPQQLGAVLDGITRTIYAEFEDPKKYRTLVAEVKEWNLAHPQNPVEIWVAPPRIFKPGEEWILKQVRSCEADGYLARNHAHLEFFSSDRIRGDFSLNVANPLSAKYLLSRYKLEHLTASYDLNISQLDALLSACPASWFEITLHQRMPLFHMEHCVFCTFMSTGKDYRDCGRPCEKHKVTLRDRIGAEHRLVADAGCRNTLFNSRAQTGAEYADNLLQHGIRLFRIEFLDEDSKQIQSILQSYRALLAGEINGQQIWQRFRLHNQIGVTRGTLAR